MYFSLQLIFHLTIIIINSDSVHSQIYGPQPKIISTNGHLIFKGALHKNISFETNGKGRVHLNGIDLINVATITTNVINVMNKYNTDFEGSIKKIDKFDLLINGNNGIMQKLYWLESSGVKNNQSTSSTFVMRNIRRINRRILQLSRSVRTLSNLLVKDECLSNPCKNGGTCFDMFNGFICHCPKEWEGSTCTKDVNECERFIGSDLGCQNGATCLNNQGSYDCLCPFGWYGLHCTRRSADCNTGSSIELCGHGTCINQNDANGYKCICDQGWATDDKKLSCNTDVDECKMNRYPCSVNPMVQCINVPGSFYCGNCPPGYTGNGYSCIDIDECEIFNGGCSMNPRVQCVNTLGSKMCGPCPPGYSGNGLTCSYLGVCNVNNGGCHQLASCRDNSRIGSTYVECVCPDGYIGNGIGPNGCLASKSSNPCLSNPCKNGFCTPNTITGDYKCTCQFRYTGKNCDTIKNPCASNPCQNGGTCRSIISFYRCVCPPSFTGTRCEQERQACGGRLEADSGVLKYPIGEINTFNHRTSCAWTIETNITKILNITFTNFSIESSGNCQYDWLQIHDGKNTAAHSLGRFCGDKLPNKGVITSSHNIVFLWFRSENSDSKKGFELNWTSVDPICGESKYITSHGSVQSPGSPGNYPLNRDCYWNLVAPAGKRFLFHFFSLMIGYDSDCNGDYLEFISGLLSSDPVFAKFCNTSQPSAIFSTGPEVTIHFHSDSSKSYPGFQITYSVVEAIPGCGGVYTMDHGEIQSPTMKSEYTSDIVCEYKIVLAEKSKIKITFSSLNLDESPSCQYNNLAIYSGSSVDDPLIGRYCGRKPPSSFIVHGNSLLIVLKSKGLLNNEGFQINYETICGGKFTNPTGVIESPTYTKNNFRKICIFEIVQPLGYVIELTINNWNTTMNSDLDCTFNYLQARDGFDANANLIGTYCNKAPSKIISTHNYLWLKLESDLNQAGIEFKASYNTTNLGCGGILREKYGTISSPQHPDIYPAEYNCKWIILAPPGNVIQFVWMNFNLEQSYKCSYDYVMIFDNNTETGMGGLMGKFCGHILPPMLLSSSNIITVIFKTDKTLNLDGFLASYSFIPDNKVCSGNYFTSAGVIKSPGYPNNYPVNRDCVWTINVDPGQQILLNVTDFNIESYSGCRYDWLEIRNGGTASSPLVGKFCGTNIPKLIPSYANKLYLHFNSDMTKNGHGFKILWSSTATGCGGTLTSPTGSLISPHYPEPYSSNTECIWKISISSGSLIQIIFADLELENHVNCILDYIEIFDGQSLNSKSLGRYCSVHPPLLRSSSNHILIKFRSDISFQGRGFHLQYSTICNNTLTGFRGIIESPNFPNTYPHNQNCLWHIKVPEQNKINLTFSHFNLESSNVYTNESNKRCTYDYLEIKYSEVKDDEEDEIKEFIKYATYCGDKTPPLITLNSNDAQLHFVSDNLLVGSGFRLEWQLDGCGEILTSPHGVITSRNYPNGYTPGIECNWKIKTDYGFSIRIEFEDLDIEKDSTCEYDFIEIYNGEDDTYPVLSKFCHQDNKPIILTTSGNFMFIKFKADRSYQGKGFKANYSSVSTKCGGKFTTPTGTIVSPNYPNNYNPKDVCEWLIEIEEGHQIELIFNDLDLYTKSNNCTDNSIKIFNGPSTDYALLDMFCGNLTPNKTIYSTYHQMTILMMTTGNIVSKGFQASYTKSCGAIIESSSSGSIQISPYSLPSSSANCTWTIIAKPPNQHVSLTISTMNIQYAYCDSSSYPIKVFNGQTEDAPILGEYCDSKIPPMVTSTGTTLHIVVQSNVDFFATYSVYDSTCGGNLTSIDGFFASPGYPNKYPQGIECEWSISVAQGSNIILNFINFELPNSEKCNSDFLEVRKVNSMGEILGIFCGSTLPNNITNVGSLWFYFKSSTILDDSVTEKGFYIEYSLVPDNELTGPSGVIESPLYPKPFMNNGKFSWKITVDFGFIVLLSFKEFYMETGYDDSCYFTYLQIFDGVDDTANSLGTFCGFAKPDPIKSTSNTIFIRVSYNTARIFTRFVLNWMQIANVQPKLIINKPNVKGCDKNEVINLNGSLNYTLTSPGYPNGYQNNLKCEWIFTTIPANHLLIYFTEINFEKTYAYTISNCFMDFVEIFQKSLTDNEWKSLAKVCQSNLMYSYKIHATNLMKVAFVTNRFNNGSGFSAQIREVCGGSLEGPDGLIIFDNTTVTGYKCQWNITAKPGKTIEVKFLLLDINTRNSCSNYIMMRNGQFQDSPLLGNGKYCGSNLPSPMRTTGNYLFVKYFGRLMGKGFRLYYREISYMCGGTITLEQYMNSTEISSPNYPNIPPPHIECIWTIRAPPGETLRIDFEERFDLYYDAECNKENVEIRDGGTAYSPLIGKFCQKMPDTQFSTDNMLFIKFVTDIDEPRNGFKAKISIGNCGGTIRKSSGVLNSELYNSKITNTNNVNCTWKIITRDTQRLQFSFQKIDFDYLLNCTNIDHVSISEYNKYSFNETSLGTFCGKRPPPDVSTYSNQAFIHLVTSAKSKKMIRPSFILNFTSLNNECGGVFESTTGIIELPVNHSIRSCQWLIKVPKGRRVKLEIITFNFEKEILFREENVMFFHDDSYSASISVNIKEPNPIIWSTDNVMSIHYWAISNVQHQRFKAKFSSSEPTVCLGDFSSSEGVLTQPKNQKSYSCSWTKESNNLQNQTVAITIDSNIAAYTLKCTHSNGFIMVYSEDNIRKIISYICKTVKNTIVRSPFPITTINTVAGLIVTINFTISYKTYPCGGIINGEFGFIKSPGFPTKYSSNMECAWLLTLPKEQRIKVTFPTFNLGDDCDKSFIEIYNGDLPTMPKIGRFCRNNAPETILSESNTLWIDYHYDSTSNGNGFAMKYEPIVEGCGGIFHNNRRFIASPYFPKDYPNNAECLWEIRAKEGYHIGFSFISRFHIEESNNCQNDYLQIWDYIDDNWSEMGKFCGRQVPKTLNSTSNRMKLLFRSNDKFTGSGFQAQWEFNCGGTFQAESKSKYITSPGYPDHYFPRLYCQYVINAPGKFINIIFDDFELDRASVTCRTDNLTISHKRSKYLSTMNETFCGDNKPPEIRLLNSVTIVFRTNDWYEKKGFRFSYRKESCGGTINTPSQVTSPSMNLPKRLFHYPGYVNCIWNITAPENQLIIVQFEILHLPKRQNCIFDNIALYDSQNITYSNRLALLCGNLNANPPTIKSKSNTLSIILKVDRNLDYEGFKANIYFTHGPKEGCGGLINLTEATTITSPNNFDYLDCMWSIVAPYEYTIQILFEKINLPGDCNNTKNSTKIINTKFKHCTCDFIEIRDGGSPIDEIIEKICDFSSNQILNRKFLSTGKLATIRLVTFGKRTDSFRVKLTPILSKCGPSILNVTHQIQTLTSPNYPDPYPDNLKCMWLFKTNNFMERLVIHFIEFDLGDNKSPTNICTNDRLQITEDYNIQIIYEGLGPQNILSGSKKSTANFMPYNFITGTQQFCGNRYFPFDYYSQKNNLLLTFISDKESNKNKGFKLEYYINNCNRNYTSAQGRIVGNKIINENCYILITVSENSTISLYFQYLLIYNCEKSGMEIYDGTNKFGKKLLKTCGSVLPSPVFSSTNNIYIHIWNKKNLISPHYDMVYTSSDKGRGCGGTFYNYKGRFTSPNYPLEYRNETECNWDIRVPYGKKVAMTFLTFDIQENCEHSYLKVTTFENGNSIDHMFCKNDFPATLHSESHLTVLYKSSIHNGGRGWLAAFEAVSDES